MMSLQNMSMDLIIDFILTCAVVRDSMYLPTKKDSINEIYKASYSKLRN
jgi:hypothetical protein